jgi:hypothetical protein
MRDYPIGLVAHDRGALAAIKPLAVYPDFESIDIGEIDDKGLCETLFSGRYRGLVIGTSDSCTGKEIETQILRWANAAALPVIAIEDYPGNYQPADGGRADVVIVGDEFARNLVLFKQPMRTPEIWVCSPVRYDSLRQRSQELREYVRKRWHTVGERWVLWAGQPETEDGLETMKRLLPSLASFQGVRLIFRAHPRDAGYSHGEYRDLLDGANVDYIDVTTDTLDSCMVSAPRIVLTQFSSVGVEAGFYGIPTVNILYPDVGGRRLSGKKGYNVPPWASVGGAFVITNEASQDTVLDKAMNNVTERGAVMNLFDSYFSSSVAAGPALAERIQQYCAGWKKG